MSLDNEFWRYSLRTYALPGVAKQALQWQDERGLNVNLLLWCTWLDEQGIILEQAHLKEAIDGLQAWDLELTQTLRKLRRGLKGHDSGVFSDDALLTSMKSELTQLELHSEQCAQAWLYQLATAFLGEPESLHASELSSGSNVLQYLTEVFNTLEAADCLAQSEHWLSLIGTTKAC